MMLEDTLPSFIQVSITSVIFWIWLKSAPIWFIIPGRRSEIPAMLLLLSRELCTLFPKALFSTE